MNVLEKCTLIMKQIKEGKLGQEMTQGGVSGVSYLNFFTIMT